MLSKGPNVFRTAIALRGDGCTLSDGGGVFLGRRRRPIPIPAPDVYRQRGRIAGDPIHLPRHRAGVRSENHVWPSADFGIALFSGDQALKSVTFNLGTWHSLQTGSSGLDNDGQQAALRGGFLRGLGARVQRAA